MSVYNQRFSSSANRPSYQSSPNFTSGSSLNFPSLSSDGRDTVYRPDSNYRLTSPSNSQISWISERIESWFGSVETFETNIVMVTGTAMLDCVTYPFIPFSHQCQLFLYSPGGVSVTAPLSTIVVLHSIMNTSGVSALWRGWRSHMMYLIVPRFLDAILHKLWRPRKIRSWNPFYWLSNLFVKSIPHLVTMPLLSYTYLEMVQSTRDKLQESLWETFTHHRLFKPDELRRLPYITLATPTVLYGLSTGIVHTTMSYFIQRILPVSSSSTSSSSSAYRPSVDVPSPLLSAVRSLWVDYFSRLLTAATLYPLQTVLVRLYCQGMPALVDDVQSGTDTAFITSYYKGFVDCITEIWDTEGFLGFFKGFSSLLVQYTIYGLVLLFIWRTVHILDKKSKG